MKNKASKSNSKKRLKTAKFDFNEWFISLLLNYLDMTDIVAMDSALCNKSIRKMFLECIANDISSVSSQIQPYLTNDQSIEWCSNRNLHFKCLELDFSDFSDRNTCPITTNGMSLLCMCCIDIIELKLNSGYDRIDNHIGEYILIELGQRCSQLKKLSITSSRITDSDIAPLLSGNHDLEDISFFDCEHLSDACLAAFSDNYHKLRMINFRHMNKFTDRGITALAINNHFIEDFQIYS